MDEKYENGQQIDEALRLMRAARGQIDQAIAAVEKGNRYNTNGYDVKDYFPFGFQDYVTRLLEPFLRVGVTRDPEQARDVVGYSAIWAAWLVLNQPKSVLAETIDNLWSHLSLFNKVDTDGTLQAVDIQGERASA